MRASTSSRAVGNDASRLKRPQSFAVTAVGDGESCNVPVLVGGKYGQLLDFWFWYIADCIGSDCTDILDGNFLGRFSYSGRRSMDGLSTDGEWINLTRATAVGVGDNAVLD